MLNKAFTNINKRSAKAYKNIVGLFAIKGVGMAIGLITVPLTLNYLDPVRYGIWITLSTFITWLALFDIGLGNGLRNRLAEAIAKNDITKARIYISTTYAGLILVFTGVYVLFFIANFFLDWTVILNTSKDLKDELSLLVNIVFLFFCIQFVINLIYTIAYAKQEPALTQAFSVLGSLLSLGGIYLLTIYTHGRLIYLGVMLASVPLITGLIITIVLFSTRYKNLKPSFKYVHFTELRSLLNIGIKFFFLQIIALVLYQTNNLIITQLFGPSEVTPYSIAFRYFGIATFAFTTILVPYWSAFTDAYARGEIDWIKKVMRNLKLIWLGLLVLVALLFFSSKFVIHLWVGDTVIVQKSLYLVMALYVIITGLLAVYSSFLNGVGKIKIQFYTSATLAIFHIPLAIYFSKQFGIMGTMFSLIFFGLIQITVFEKQYRKIINNTDSGIWSK
jgi:O-antigen/teichoic acid export membrane protein